MAETKSRSIRVDDDVWAAFCARKGTQNEVMQELLAPKDEPDKLAQHVEGLKRSLAELPTTDDVADVMRSVIQEFKAERAASAGHAAPSVPTTNTTAPFNPTCKHCGETFGAFNRFATLCTDCKQARHIGDPRDCPMCFERQGAI